MPTVRDALRQAAQAIQAAGSEEGALEAELLLGHALRLDRVHVYQRLADPLPPARERAFRRLLDRRTIRHQPVPYILGHKEFFGLDFEVTPAAIIPRPETETLVEHLLAFARERYRGAPFTVADVGVGCGAIAVTVAHEMPEARVIAVDLSKRALRLAERNAVRHGVAGRIEFLQGNLLHPLASQRIGIIAANLPYVRTDYLQQQPPEVREHEPRRGLDGGTDGLRLIRRLLRQAPSCVKPGSALFVEIAEDQGAEAARLAARSFPHGRIEVRHDLSGLDRVLVVRV